MKWLESRLSAQCHNLYMCVLHVQVEVIRTTAGVQNFCALNQHIFNGVRYKTCLLFYFCDAFLAQTEQISGIIFILIHLCF